MAEDLPVPVAGTQGSASVAPRTTVVWHPKLTPYRALNLIVGIGVGSLKVLLVYKAVVHASIAVEWVRGTVIFVILYVLGMHEENSKNNHRGRSWFFNYDCMILFWRLIKRFGVEPRVYSTEEDPDSDTALSGPQALVTNYRMLVSAIVVGFGMAKASLAYRNLNSDATVLDWIFGVVVTSLLYIVGLYENNPAKRLKSLFDRNDSEAAFKMFIGTFLATCCLVILPILLFVRVFCVSSISTFIQFFSGFDNLDCSLSTLNTAYLDIAGIHPWLIQGIEAVPVLPRCEPIYICKPAKPQILSP
ncbi:hypothetical protein BJ165DRAFT_438407 [Panaeolus papilionaceus]|nr:hypothetical protein BJ165DRAFT_438407 [Panaeolus papilionaceus]